MMDGSGTQSGTVSLRASRQDAARIPGVPIEKRVNAYMVASSPLPATVSSLFENFLVGFQKSTGRDTGPRMRNSILVNERKEELSISAGGPLDGVYAFTHTNKDRNSVEIAVYLGPNRSLEFGKELLFNFRDYLNVNKFSIKDYLVLSNEDEAAEEKHTQGMIDEYVQHRTRSIGHSMAFALDLACRASGY
jgi:hypothetical protein